MIENWKKDAWNVYTQTAKSLRNLSQQLARQWGHTASLIDAIEKPFCTMSKMGSGGSIKIENSPFKIVIIVDSCHYGINADKVALILYRDENELGKMEITMPPRQLEYGAVANALREVADFIDRDQWMKGANGDFASFSSYVEVYHPKEDVQRGSK